MPNPVPSQLSLTSIADGSSITAAPHRNNYAAIQAAVNEIIAALSNGTAGQFLQAVDGADVQWGNAADKSSASTQDFTAAVYSGATAGLPTTQTGAGVLPSGEFSAIAGSTSAVGAAISVANNVDTQPRFTVKGDGSITWGPGSAGGDTSIYRAGPATVKFNGALLGDGTGIAAGLGYGPGCGGAVTQGTGRSTAVTLNTICGSITSDTSSIANGASASFTVNNSQVGARDLVIVQATGVGTNGSGAPNFYVTASASAAGSFIISYVNNSGGASTSAVVFNFAILRAANA